MTSRVKTFTVPMTGLGSQAFPMPWTLNPITPSSLPNRSVSYTFNDTCSCCGGTAVTCDCSTCVCCDKLNPANFMQVFNISFTKIGGAAPDRYGGNYKVINSSRFGFRNCVWWVCAPTLNPIGSVLIDGVYYSPSVPKNMDPGCHDAFQAAFSCTKNVTPPVIGCNGVDFALIKTISGSGCGSFTPIDLGGPVSGPPCTCEPLFMVWRQHLDNFGSPPCCDDAGGGDVTYQIVVSE